MTSHARAVFLDRDGVLNAAIVRDGKPYPPASLAELVIAPDAFESLQRLRAAGYLLIVVTNQPDLARGAQTRETLEQIHSALRAAMHLDAIYICDHDGPDACDCRKPKPGMLLAAARDFGIDLTQSVMVGDRWRDVDAGARAGCRTVFLDYGYAERAPDAVPDLTVPRLRDAVDWILTAAVPQTVGEQPQPETLDLK
jgi:D-glycero-D-manno-heptose 1,7-bisphosphate phosphatase